MFRQVVAQTWAPGVTADERNGFFDALDRLRSIPEVISVRGGADVEIFDGNYDLVTVLDFADFASARRYVDHPDHQAFLTQWARPLTDKRIVVQHEWACGSVAGFHHLKVPVNDVVRSRTWYQDALGFEPHLEFVEDGALRGVSLRHPAAGVRLGLRHDPPRAAALAGFDMVALAVGTRGDLAGVIERARAAGATPGEVVQGREGWACDLTDPDGIVVRLYTHERHD